MLFFLVFALHKKKKKKFSEIEKRKNSQNLNDLSFENGAIYIFQTKGFLNFKNRLFGKIGIYYMEKINSIDIDDMEDVNLVKQIMKL